MLYSCESQYWSDRNSKPCSGKPLHLQMESRLVQAVMGRVMMKYNPKGRFLNTFYCHAGIG